MMTFGNQLKRFSRAVDIVTDDMRKSILRILTEQLQKSLGINFVTLHVEAEVDGKSGLHTSEWYVGGDKISSISLKNSDGTHTTQVALSFSSSKILWIVCKNKGALADCNQYFDLFSRIDSSIIPKYLKHSKSISKTSVILPVFRHRDNRPYGVINFESTKYIEPSDSLEKEISMIAEAISRLYLRNVLLERQIDDTEEEIAELNTIISRDLTQIPSLFFAFSGIADTELLNAIDDIFCEDKYSNLDLKRWNKDYQVGNIQSKIFDNIRECHFGICYLSEHDGEGGVSRQCKRIDRNWDVLVQV